MVLFTLTAPMLDAFAKLATDEATPMQIAFARFAVQSVLLVPVLILTRRLIVPPGRELRLHALRGAFMAVATLLFFTALTEMAIADAIAIFFVQPMILTLLSAPLLGEPVGWRRYLACAVGFSGALLVIQPSFSAFGWLAAAPLGAACCFAFYLIFTRKLAQSVDAVSMQFWSGLFGAMVMAGALGLGAAAGSAVFAVNAVSPYTMALMLGMGLFATFSHLAIVSAFARAPASVLAPLQYLEIIAATAIGFLVFGDFPDALTWTGIAIIIASGMVIIWREQAAARRRSGAGEAV